MVGPFENVMNLVVTSRANIIWRICVIISFSRWTLIYGVTVVNYRIARSKMD
jgi:hypothetical protein